MERSVIMVATRLKEPPRPSPDAVCRMLASDADWAAAADLHSAEDDSTDPAEPGGYEQRRMAARRAQQEAGLGGWFGAFVDGEMLCGLGLFTNGAGLGRFQSVDTVESARRRGLASILLHHASLVGQQIFGIREVVIVADPDYSAIRMYRSLGFEGSEIQIQLARPVPGP